MVVEAEHAHATAHADAARGDAESHHEQVFARLRVHAHVGLGLDDRARADARARVAVQHRDVDARRHADGAETGAGGQGNVMEVVGRCDHHRLAARCAREITVHVRVLVDVGLRVGGDDVHRRGHRHADRAAADAGGVGVDLVSVGGGHGHALHRRGVYVERAVAARAGSAVDEPSGVETASTLGCFTLP